MLGSIVLRFSYACALYAGVVNKIVKTIQTVLFVVVAFLITGDFVVSAFNMLCLLILVDFVTLSLATDNASAGTQPERWPVRTADVAVLVSNRCLLSSSEFSFRW
jgi:H+-transporting ATPase